MKRTTRAFLTNLLCGALFFLAIMCAGAGLALQTAAAETPAVISEEDTQSTLQSNSIIKTTALGEIDVSSLTMKEGAAVRLKDLENPENSRNGLRFTALFNRRVYEKLEELDAAYDNVSVNYGMLIVPYDYIQSKGELTVANIFGENAIYYIDGVTPAVAGRTKIGGWNHLDLPEEDDDTRTKEIYCSIINISKSQLTREWVGVSYIQYTEDGVSQYYMTEALYENARSMVYVAQKALRDTKITLSDDQKTWLTNNYTEYEKTENGVTVSIPDKKYRYTVNHILVDPLGNETIKETTEFDAKLINTEVSAADQQKTYEGYTLDTSRTVSSDIIYANHRTALNYYYNMEHCDVVFEGTKCTMAVDGKAGETLSYVALDGATSFSFSIVPDTGFKSGAVTVTVDGASVTADGNGLYTVSLANKKDGDQIVITATVKAGTVSDQVFEDSNYNPTGEQSETILGAIAGWLGYGELKVDADAGTITSSGGSVELSSEFIKNALQEGYTHMVCDVAVTKKGIGTFTKLETINGGSTKFYQKVGTSETRTDRIDLTEFELSDGKYDSLLFRAYRRLFSSEAVSASATVQLSNIRLYRSSETTNWTKYDANGNVIKNSYAAYEDGNLVIETLTDGAYFKTNTDTFAYDLSVDVSMSFAFKYLTQGANTDSFFYHFGDTMSDQRNTLSSCHMDDRGYYHMCILPETIAALPNDSIFYFGLEKPGTALISRANSGVAVHTRDGEVVADTWGYPYGHGVYNEYLQVNNADLAKEGVRFNVNTNGAHTIRLTITSDVDFTGFWYGNDEWEGYKAGMREFTSDDVDRVTLDGSTQYIAEIVYAHNYMDKGFNIHWRGTDAEGKGKTGTMKLHYTLISQTVTEYYTFVPNNHVAGVHVSEKLEDGIKVESLTGVQGTIFTMPIFDTENEKTVSLTVSATWDFSDYLTYGNGADKKYAFAAQKNDKTERYEQTITLTATFTDGFKIVYETVPTNVQATIDVTIAVDNFNVSVGGDTTGEVTMTEIYQTDGWVKIYAENVQPKTYFDFPAMPTYESITAYVTSNIPLDGTVMFGTPGKQMLQVIPEMISTNINGEEIESYVALFTYCNPTEGYEGFQIAFEYRGDAFPDNAWVQIQYRFTDFKIQNTGEIGYTAILEIETTDKETEETWEQATLYSQASEARFWLDTTGYAEISGTITSSVALSENTLYYGHGWGTTGVIAVDPTKVTNNDGTWTYSFTYHENLENGFCIYYTNDGNGNSFAGTVTVRYQLYTMDDIVGRASSWSVEDGGVTPTFKTNGHVVYESAMKQDGTGYELYIDASVVEIAYTNGCDIIGITFASDDVFNAYILNGSGAMIEFRKAGIIEHTEFSINMSELYTKDDSGNLIFHDLVLRFDYVETDQAGEERVEVVIEEVEFINVQPIAEQSAQD